MYSKEEEIIHFVFLAFMGQKRKKEDIDIAFHSIMVGNMLKNLGCDEKIVYIGYLHDVIEDTKYTYDDIKNRFGKDIADGVLNVTDENNAPTWNIRKERFIDKIKKSSDEILMVELADKLQNLVSDYSLYLETKEDVLMKSEKDRNYKWYYKEFQKMFNERLNDNDLLRRYNKIIDMYFA